MSIANFGLASYGIRNIFFLMPAKKVILFISLLGLVSCIAPVAKKNSISLTLVASSDLNPDINGRASPLALTIYQLKSSSSFKKNDYMSLVEHSKSILGRDLIAVNTLTIRPGQTLDIDYPVSEAEGAFGIVAGYRVIDSSGWQLVYEYPRVKAGFLPKLGGKISSSYKILFEKNKIKLEPLSQEH
ncbi:type VI secretion system lipoprotein TssJ [Cellvibrio sp.]